MSTNPFYVGTKAEDSQQFFGRVAEVGRIVESLATLTTVSVIGETQIGSSSLLSYVAQRGWEKHSIAETETDHWTQILTDYDLHSFDMALFPDTKHFFTAMLNTLGTTGNTAHKINDTLDSSQRKTVFFLDEFDATVDNTKFNTDFFNGLRGIADKGKIALVIATKTSISQLVSDGKINSTSPFDNLIGVTIQLGPLPDNEAYDLLKGLAALGGYTLTTEELKLIVKEGKGYPRRLRQLGRIVIEKRQQGQKPAKFAEVKKQFAQEMQLRKPRRKIPWPLVLKFGFAVLGTSTIVVSIVLAFCQVISWLLASFIIGGMLVAMVVSYIMFLNWGLTWAIVSFIVSVIVNLISGLLYDLMKDRFFPK